MASAVDSENETDNLEIFSFIWLDAIEDIEEIQKTEKKLRKIINHLKRFNNVKQCQQYIEQISEQNRLILVVSGRFGRELVPIIHKFRQITLIYVYCMDRESNEKWSCEYTKVKLYI
jgi:plasmid stabilization system protein ParE